MTCGFASHGKRKLLPTLRVWRHEYAARDQQLFTARLSSPKTTRLSASLLRAAGGILLVQRKKGHRIRRIAERDPP